MECKYCKKSCKNKNSLVQHEIRCKENPDRIIPTSSRIKWTEERKREHSKRIKEGFEKSGYVPGQHLTEASKKKISQALKDRARTYWTPETKKKHSEAMKKAVNNNPDSYSASNVSGRVKTIEYNGFKLKGSWELNTAKWLDANGITWTNEIKPFPYKWDGSIRNYFPDFYLPNEDIYIEVKGYEREQDVCKWNDFPHKLIVLKKNQIEKINENKFTIDYLYDENNHWTKVETKKYLEEQAKELRERPKKKSKGFLGRKHTAESKRKMSENNGAKLSKELVESRRNDYLCSYKENDWAMNLASKWGVSHSTVTRFVRIYCSDIIDMPDVKKYIKPIDFLIEERKKDYLSIEPINNWVDILSKKWGVDESQTRKFIKKHFYNILRPELHTNYNSIKEQRYIDFVSINKAGRKKKEWIAELAEKWSLSIDRTRKIVNKEFVNT